MSSLDISNENNRIIIIKKQSENYLSNYNRKKDLIILKKLSKDENKHLNLNLLNDAKSKKTKMNKN